MIGLHLLNIIQLIEIFTLYIYDWSLNLKLYVYLSH
jgi:hypothetical protein